MKALREELDKELTANYASEYEAYVKSQALLPSTDTNTN